MGDARFTKKSRQRIESLWEHSSTILFVSHSLEYVRDLCDRTIWLNNGEIVYHGKTEEAIQLYLESVGVQEYVPPPQNT